MTIRFRVIASGSNGNAAYLSTPDGTLLIDAGISRKRILNALIEDNIPFRDVKGILVTHAHTDHCQGLPVLCDHLRGVPLLCTPGTKKVLKSYGDRRDIRYSRIFENSYLLPFNEPFIMENEHFSIFTLPTIHDAEDSSAFQISYKDVKLTVLTDTGKINSDHLQALKDSSIVLLEMNHDFSALENSRRPVWLKRRIRAVHLSNNETIEALESLVDSEIRGVFVGHLSGECNSPKLVSDSLARWQNDQSLPWNWYLCRRNRSGKKVEYSGDQLTTTSDIFQPKKLETYFDSL